MTEEEKKYAFNDLTHIDFVIYNTVTKKLILAIEVDGYKYHKYGTKQARRDILKNHIFEVYNIPYLRLSTTGSDERGRIIKKLAACMT
ncbi:MAG: DUF2726 domain-containing protein [Treponema sp.]|nr:DUF2726 domain-containing protein [Treponema sp.]